MAKKPDKSEEELDRISEEFHAFIKEAFHAPRFPIKQKSWRVVLFWTVVLGLIKLSCTGTSWLMETIHYNYPLGF